MIARQVRLLHEWISLNLTWSVHAEAHIEVAPNVLDSFGGLTAPLCDILARVNRVRKDSDEPRGTVEDAVRSLFARCSLHAEFVRCHHSAGLAADRPRGVGFLIRPVFDARVVAATDFERCFISEQSVDVR